MNMIEQPHLSSQGGVQDEHTQPREITRGQHASVVDLVNSLIRDAYLLRASDIHISPTDTKLRIRLRVDGVLQDRFFADKSLHAEVISRIKVLSGLRTDEHQAAQDGRFRIAPTANEHHPIDIRVSITPTYYGENAVLRLLGDKNERFSLESLGFTERDRERIENAIHKPFGMILATGPTGSGKTTTLYTLIRMLSEPDVSIVTIEDPVEYAMSDITQIQINPRTGLSFANGLRSILRQDPNIVMVGEIRDAETASIAVNTALTGHLLLSTIHTNDAATTLPRLLDMGVDAYLVASTVNIAIGQRLIRRICRECKHDYELTDGERARLRNIFNTDDVEHKFFVGAGCESCGGSGYKGRLGIYEVLVVDDPIREAILNKVSSTTLREIAITQGMTTMLDDGFKKALDGETTFAEVLRTINE